MCNHVKLSSFIFNFIFIEHSKVYRCLYLDTLQMAYFHPTDMEKLGESSHNGPEFIYIIMYVWVCEPCRTYIYVSMDHTCVEIEYEITVWLRIGNMHLTI